MDKLGRVTLLLDFYGPLLTEKQRSYLDMHYNQDLSFGEIAEEGAVTRQAVFDIIKRGQKVLEEYESKLGLVSKFLSEREKLRSVDNILKECKQEVDVDRLDQALLLLAEIIEIENN